jgi:hypothetical protein
MIDTITLIARVRIAAITSREPPKTRLSSRVGSYSHIAVAFSTAAIFVICSITSTFPRLMTCPKQLASKWGKVSRRNSKINSKLTVTVIRCYSTLEDRGDYGYLQWSCRLCYCYPCYLMLPCRAARSLDLINHSM